MPHSAYSPEQREAHDISDGLIRMSVGLENVEDIKADFAQAFSAIETKEVA